MTFLRLLVLISLIILVVITSLWVNQNPGHVQLDWMGYRINTSFWVVLTGVALTILSCCFLFWVVMKLFYVTSSYKKTRALKHHDRAYDMITDVIVSLSLHNYAHAGQALEKTRKHIGNNALTTLLEAHLTSKSGDDMQKLQSFNKLSDYPSTRYLASRALTRHHILSHANDAAMEEAKRAYKLRPDLQEAVIAYLDRLLQASQFSEAHSVVTVAARQKVITKAQRQHFYAVIHYTNFFKSEHKHSDLLKAALDASASFAPAYDYISQLYHARNDRAAWKALCQTWKAAPHAALTDILMHSASQEPEKLLKRAQLLLNYHPEHIESHILIARAAMVAQQWGIARNHLKAALEIDRQGRILRLFAALEREELQDNDKANLWLEQLRNATPDPAWHCTLCAHSTKEWSVNCTSCHGFDSLEWHNHPYAQPAGTSRGVRFTHAPLDFLEA
jgi:HemY protein